MQTSGAISLSNIQSEFGGSNPISISEYIRGGSLVPDTDLNSDIPTSLSNISFSDFYGSSVALPIFPPPKAEPSPLSTFGSSGGLGNTNYEIVTGIRFENQSNELVPTFNDQRPNPGSASRGGSNIVYTDKIMQAKPGDTIFIEAHAYTSSSYYEYFEFWAYNLDVTHSTDSRPSGAWKMWGYSDRVYVPPSGSRRSKTLKIPEQTLPGNYAIAVALSYYTLEATSYRSWRSYSLHIYSDLAFLVNPGGPGLIRGIQ